MDPLMILLSVPRKDTAQCFSRGKNSMHGGFDHMPPVRLRMLAPASPCGIDRPGAAAHNRSKITHAHTSFTFLAPAPDLLPCIRFELLLEQLQIAPPLLQRQGENVLLGPVIVPGKNVHVTLKPPAVRPHLAQEE